MLRAISNKLREEDSKSKETQKKKNLKKTENALRTKEQKLAKPKKNCLSYKKLKITEKA